MIKVPSGRGGGVGGWGAAAVEDEVVEGALILNDRPCKLSEIN